MSTASELLHKHFLSNTKDLRAVSGAVQYVQTSVGQPIKLSTRFDVPTLWCATSFVAEGVERVGGGLKTLEDAMIPMKADLLETINTEFD
jgi:hypothetical protein